MIAAYSVDQSVVLFISSNAKKYRLERCKLGESQWKTFTGKRFALLEEEETQDEEIEYYTVEEAAKFIKSLSEEEDETYTIHVKDSETKSCEALYEALLGLTFEEGTTYKKDPYEGPYIKLDLENATSLEIGERALQGYPIGASGCYGYALKEIILPKTCTYIGDHALAGQASLEKVTLPKSLETIDVSAFWRCLKLKEINLESCTSLKYIGLHSFEYCTSLEEVTLPENLEELCCMAFLYDDLLKKVDMSLCKHLKYIGQNTFYYCPSLEEITLYDSRKEGYEWGHGGYDSDHSSSECKEHYENPAKDDVTIVHCFQDNLIRCLTKGMGDFTCTCEENHEEEGCDCKEIEEKTKSGGEYHWYRVVVDEDKLKEAIKENIKEKIEEIIEENKPFPVGEKFIDTFDLEDTLYIYRCIDFAAENPENKDYEYSNNVRVSGDSQVGYTFGNYHPAPGTWGEVVTPDDLRYTYLWGTDFKATNGQSFTDEQIEFYINASVADIERKLDITIVKQKIRSDAEERGLEKGKDYDVDEAVYDFAWSRIERYGFIKTRQRPILKLHKLTLLSRLADVRDMTKNVIIDKTKGLLKFLKRPIKPTQTSFGIQTAINQYGSETMGAHLFYRIDYDAGYETSDDVPADLREIVAKHASVNLLNVVGDGLMSGFSSSSLSMDGLSESFSSTQSATSAYFGARIKEYKDDIEDYIKANRNKFGHMIMGCL